MGDDDTRIAADGEGDDRSSPADRSDAPQGRVVVPWDRLSAEALSSIIEEFVTREGTEYGPTDVPLENKVAEVRRALERGDVVVLFDARTETVNLAVARDVGDAET